MYRNTDFHKNIIRKPSKCDLARWEKILITGYSALIAETLLHRIVSDLKKTAVSRHLTIYIR